MASTYTTHYNLEKPDPNADININPINGDLDDIDAAIYGVQSDLNSKANYKTVQEYIFCNLSSSGSTSTNTISSYPTQPGIYRVGSASGITGLPTGINGYGALLIGNAGTYIFHLYIDNNKRLYWAIKTGSASKAVEPPSVWRYVQGTEVNAAT